MNNISLKSPGPWYTIEADNHDDAVTKLLALLGDARPPQPVSLPTLIGLAQVWYEAELALGLSGVNATPIPQQEAVPVAQSPWGNSQPASVAPATQPGAPVAPTAPGGGSELPAGIRFWTAPDPKNSQYQAVFFDLPPIADKVAGDAFRKTLKDNFWAKWNGVQGDGSAWYASAHKAGANGANIKPHFVANAHLFQ